MHESGDRVYTDETAPMERRVDDLLSRMTVEDKAAQLGSVNAERLLEDGELAREAARQSIVVLDNEDDLLPVEGHDSVAVVETETLSVTETADVPRNGRGYFTKTTVDEH